MTRIVAGAAKGRVLKVPDKGTRPTSERVREALFSRLDHWDCLEDATVLDLFAGTGALALEALSRGSARATAVDSARGAVKALKANAAATGLQLVTHAGDVASYLGMRSGGEAGEYTLVFIDPPYDLPEETLTQVLARLGPWITPDALIVVERSARSPEPTWPAFLRLEEHSTWGETRCWFAGPPLPDQMVAPDEATALDEATAPEQTTTPDARQEMAR